MFIQPTRENYAAWVEERRVRTQAVIERQVKITGRQVRQENLSARQIYDAGYELNLATDTLEKING